MALVLQRPGFPEIAGSLAAGDRREATFNLRDLLRIFLKRKWTILIIFSVFALFSVVRTYLAPPVYRASTTIQIEKFLPRVFDYKEVQPMEAPDENADFYYTNYELLKSRTLAERAVEEIGLRKNPPPESVSLHPAKRAAAPQPQHAGSEFQDPFNRPRNGPQPWDPERAHAHKKRPLCAFHT